MGIVDSLKRLENSGKERSRVTDQLMVVSEAVAVEICHVAPLDVKLPRGYKAVRIHSNIGYNDYLVAPSGELVNGDDSNLHGDCHVFVEKPSRQTILNFSKDISEGLLGEIADFIDNMSKEDEQAIEQLEKVL